MKNLQISLILVGLFFIGCSGNGDSENKVVEKTVKVENRIEDVTLAKDALLHDVVKKFGNYTLKVIVDKNIGENDVSQDIVSVYGFVNGKNTEDLLKLNSNYPKGTKIVVEVYDSSDNLVAVSTPKEYSSDIVDFGSLNIK